MRNGGGNNNGRGAGGGGGGGNSNNRGGGSRRRSRNKNRQGSQNQGPNQNRGGGPQSPRSGQPQKTGGSNGQQQGHHQPRPPREPQLPPVKSLVLQPKRFAVSFHETFQHAKADLDGLKRLAAEVDQLNIVIAEEGNMDDPILSEIGKVFAGAAWTLIHKRRVDDGWYEKMQPAGTVIPAVRAGQQHHG